MLFTRIRLATAGCPNGYASVAAQNAQTYAPVVTAENGDGHGADVALEVKYLVDGESRIQELHDKLANFQVTAADTYDPTRVSQELHHICVDLEALGDVVFPLARHALSLKRSLKRSTKLLKTVLR